MTIMQARRIVHLVENMKLTMSELGEFMETKTPNRLYLDAWMTCMKADIASIEQKMSELQANTDKLNELIALA